VRFPIFSDWKSYVEANALLLGIGGEKNETTTRRDLDDRKWTKEGATTGMDVVEATMRGYLQPFYTVKNTFSYIKNYSISLQATSNGSVMSISVYKILQCF
jgi:hypothetical protein